MIPLFKRTTKAKVFLDTNFLLLMGSQGLDIFTGINELLDEPHELCVLNTTLKELQSIIDGKTKARGQDKFNAKLGFILVKQKGLKTISSSKEYVDDGLVALADANTYFATLDKALQKRLQDKGAKIIYVKGKTQLAKK